MSLPSPYLASSKELAPLSKGVPPIRLYYKFEQGMITIYRFGQVVYRTSWLPLSRLPAGDVSFYGRPTDKVHALFSLASWSRGYPDVVHLPIVFPRRSWPKAGRVVVRLPGSGGAIPAVVRRARRRVGTIRENRAIPKKRNPRSSSLRPSPEVLTRPYNNVTEGNNGGYFLTVTPSSYTRFRRVWSGVRTPNFGKLKKTRLPVNAHNVRITEWDDGPGVFLNHIPSTGIFFNRFTTFTTFYGVPSDSSSHMSEAQFKALRNLISKAQIGIEANLAQDFAQIGQTVRLIGSTAKRLTQAITSLKNGNIPGAVKNLWGGHLPRYNGKGPSASKSLANNWLELQYGWKPLLQDIHGSMNSLAQLNVASPFVQRVTASGTVDLLSDVPIMHRVGTSTRAGTSYTYTQTKCKYVIRYKIDDHLKTFLAQTGFTNPINLLWEIMPFSFVVDWFTPIGPFLETLSSWDGLSFLDGSISQFTRNTVQSVVDFSGAVPQAPGQLYEEHARWTQRTTILSRAKLTAFPSAYMPSGFKNGLASITHAENALALMRAAFK